jgi:DNA helicase-2/ATP-dependent DNA helicase PcrA
MPLTSEQNYVVTAKDGHIVVLAGPGSGKTHTIIEKIIYLFSEDIIPDPYGLLAITFTNAAANEMRSRLRSKGFSQWNRIWVGTFHSFGLYLLTCYGSDVGVREDFNIVDIEVQKEFINKSFHGHLNSKEIEALKSAIEGLKRKGIYPNMGDAQVENKLRITYHKYQQLLNEHNLLDFGDLVALSVLLLKQSALAKRLFTNFFRYIIVDEFQDSDNQQLEMIHILAQGATGSTIVADDDQSIYRFRGAIRENVLKIKELLKAEEIVLGANFRSDQVIVKAAKAVIGYEANRTPKEIEAVSKNYGCLYKREFPNIRAEAEQVVKWIGELISQQQVKDLGEIAIITRAGYRAKCVLEEMNKAKISWFDRSRLAFQDSWETALGLAILSLACDRNSSDRLHLLVSAIEDGGLAFRLGDKDALDLAVRIRELLLASMPFSAIPENAKTILDIAKCEQVIHKVCWSYTDARRLVKNLDTMIATITQESQSLRLNLNDTINRLAGYGAVQVMSGHGAKGREFEQVFLIGLEDDVLPGYRTHNNENDIAEERRIFYVALTRARKAAYLTSAEERDNRKTKQSRFINHIPKEFFSPLPPLGIQKVS